MTPLDIIRAAHRQSGATLFLDEHDTAAVEKDLGKGGFALLSATGIEPHELWTTARRHAFRLVVISRPRTARELFRVLSLVEPNVFPGGKILILPYTPPDGGAENRYEATEVFLGVHSDWTRRLIEDAGVVELSKAATEFRDEPVLITGAPQTDAWRAAEIKTGPARKRVISLAVFGRSHYGQYLGAYVRAHLTLFPGYELRIHHDEELYRGNYGGTLHGLQERGLVKLVYMGSDALAHGKCRAMLWRLAPAWDSDVEYVFARDVDSLPTWTERRACEEFIASGLDLHTIHANPAHCGIMGGLCGVRAEALRKLAPTFDDFVALAGFSPERWAQHGADQDHLNNAVAPRLTVFEHSLIEQFHEDGATRLYRHASEWTGGGHSHLSERFSTEAAAFDDPAVAVDVREAADRQIPYPGVAGHDHEKAVAFYDAHCPAIYAIKEAEHNAGELPTGERAKPNESRAVYSTDLNPDYSFYAPITSALWLSRMGYRPLLFLVGAAEEWLADARGRLVVDRCRSIGVEIVFTGAFSGQRTATVAQVSRLFGAHVLGMPDDAYLLTADVDMWPLGPWVGGARNPEKALQVFGANAYVRDERVHYPICYLGASAATWRDIMGDGAFRGSMMRAFDALAADLATDGKESDGEKVWFFDERYFGDRLGKWPGYPSKVQQIQRQFGPGEWRIDRSDWRVPVSLSGIADAHLIRPGFTDENWQRIRPVLAMALPEKWLAWVDAYRAAWCSL